MSWVKLDDNFPEHPKVISLSDSAFRAYMVGLCYASRYLTDGVIPSAAIRQFSSRKATDELLAACLWEQTDAGVRVHDFLEYNPSKEQVMGEREKAKARMDAARSGNVRPNKNGTKP